jgi:hypothetical protein
MAKLLDEHKKKWKSFKILSARYKQLYATVSLSRLFSRNSVYPLFCANIFNWDEAINWAQVLLILNGSPHDVITSRFISQEQYRTTKAAVTLFFFL